MSYHKDNPLGLTGRPQVEIIVRNSAQCDKCKESVESTHRHDFRSCKCGRLQVDGGKDYIKRGFQGDGGPTYTDTSMSFYREMHNNQIQEYHGYGLL